MHIVNAKRGDCQEVCLFRENSIRGLVSSEYSDALLESNSYEGVLDELEKEKVFLIFEDKIIVGSVSVSKNQISGLYVHPNYSNKGIGGYLLKYAEKYLRKKNYKRVYLYSTKDNYGFYALNGYFQKSVAYSFNTKIPLEFIKMEKEL